MNGADLALVHELRAHQQALVQQESEIEELRRELHAWRDMQVELYELAPVAYASVDATGSIVEANLATSMLLGVPRSELLTTKLIRYVAPRDRDALASVVAEAIERGEKSSRDVQLHRRNGTPIQVHLGGVPVGSAKARRAHLVLQDITERVELQTELERHGRMDALGRLTTAVAHDFNNLLMGIIGCADMALCEQPQSSNAHGLIAELKAAALRGASLTGKLLEAVRGHGPVHVVANLNEVVLSSEAVLRGMLGNRIELFLRASRGGARVRVGPGEIERILTNLAMNARRAMPDRGRVSIEVAPLDINAQEAAAMPSLAPGRYVLLTVRDTGIGMDEPTRLRALEPFYSGSQRGRLGLGLATVHTIVVRAGGQISIESEPGKGTVVRIVLPRVDEPPVEAPAARPLRAAPIARVLVIEDDALVRRTVRHYLERSGYGILEADSAARALEVYDSQGGSVDLVLADVVLPDRSGPDVVGELAERRPGLKIVLMSGDPTFRARIKGLKGVGALRKPFDEKTLLAEVHRALGQIPGRAQAGTLLLVENNEMSRVAIDLFLKARNYRVFSASSGVEAREICSRFPGNLDVIVCDLGLDDIPGDVLVAEICEQHTPGVVFISGLDPADDHVGRALRQPRSTFLRKPFDLMALARAVSEAGGGGRTFRPTAGSQRWAHVLQSFPGDTDSPALPAGAAEPTRPG